MEKWTFSKRYVLMGIFFLLVLIGMGLTERHILIAKHGTVNCVVVTDEVPYVKIGDTVDMGTYNGYRRFNGMCLRCHGGGGVGSTFAPALIDSLKTMSKKQFIDTVTHGKSTPGRDVVMPAWENNPDVMNNINDLYSYIKARSNGAIGLERPQKNDAIKCNDISKK